VILGDLAHSRAGDKGTIVNVSVIAFDPNDYAWLESVVTAARMQQHLDGIADGGVVRYTLPSVAAFNFVFARKPGQSVTRTLELDAHGKTLSSIVLAMPLPER
jgi:hypothetical protein